MFFFNRLWDRRRIAGTFASCQDAAFALPLQLRFRFIFYFLEVLFSFSLLLKYQISISEMTAQHILQ